MQKQSLIQNLDEKAKIVQQSKQQQPISSNSLLSELLVHQENFITTIHKNLFSQTNYEKTSIVGEDQIMKFEVDYLTDITTLFNKMIKELTTLFVEEKKHYNIILRDRFHRILNCDYLPLIRFNKYELITLSLYGFDIYIQPLQAILEILNRIDNARQVFLANKNQIRCFQNEGMNNLVKGWSNYHQYLCLYRIHLNSIMLREYLKIANHSLNRKQKEIVFTGCFNLWSFIPILLDSNNVWLVLQLANLNNQLYNFHHSYDVLRFFINIKPTIKNQPIYSSLKVLALKCQNTNILTPLLFGIMRNHSDILNWIDQIKHNQFTKYLEVLLIGLLINMKARILQYEQILLLIKKTMLKLGLLNHFPEDGIVGDLQGDWSQAKQFFISALKLSHSIGEFQTWRSISPQKIQQQIINYTINSILLLNNFKSHKLLQQMLQKPEQYFEILFSQIAVKNQTKITVNIVLNTPSNLQCSLTELIQLVNLSQLTKNNENISLLMSFIITLNNMDIESQKRTIPEQKLQYILNTIVQQISRQHSIEQKYITVLEQFYRKFKPCQFLYRLCQLLLENKNIKEQYTKILYLCIQQPNHIQILTKLLIIKYFPKTKSKSILIKTFRNQYQIGYQSINLCNKSRLCLLAIIDKLKNKIHESINKSILFNIIKCCKWICLGLLMLPIEKGDQVELFMNWALKNSKELIYQTLKNGINTVFTNTNEDYFKIIIMPTICQNLVANINEKINQSEKCLELIPDLKLLHCVYKMLHVQYTWNYDILKCYQQIITQFVLQYKSEQNIDLFIEVLHEYFDILRPSFAQINEKIRKNNRIFNGQRDKNITIYKIQHFNSTNTIIIEYHQNHLIEEIETLTNQDIQTMIHSGNPQSSTNLQEKQPILISNKNQQIYTKNIKIDTTQKNWKLEFLKYKELIIPQIPSELIHRILKQSNVQHLFDILNLNPFNSLSCALWAIKQKNKSLLIKIGFNKLLIPYIDKLYEVDTEDQTYLEAMSMMDIQEMQSLANCYLLTTSNVEQYLFFGKLQFLTVRNQSNWRVLIDYFIEQIESLKVTSILLQYEEYLQITNTLNKQYTEKIEEFTKIVRLYNNYLSLRTEMILQYTTPEQLRILKINQIANVKLFVSAARIKQTLMRLAQFNKCLEIRQIDKFEEIIEILFSINEKINKFQNSQIVLPNFLTGNRFTNASILSYQFYLGQYLQEYEITVYEDIRKQNQRYIYTPQLNISTWDESLDKYPFTTPHKIIIEQDLQQEWANILQQMENVVTINGNILSFKNYILQKSNSESPSLQKEEHQLRSPESKQSDNTQQGPRCSKQEMMKILSYKLGVLYYHYQKNNIQLCPVLLQSLSRKPLQWELLKQQFGEEYHQIKSILMTKNIKQQEKFFIYKEKQLIPNGKEIIITENNKKQYCNLIAESCFNINIKQFVRALYYQI